ncbi:MAG: hypothetical protein ABGW95_02810, partial [Candidatus Poseidoniia archaeon]
MEPGQTTIDLLHELKADNLAPKLTKEGWKFDKEGGEKIDHGHRFFASRDKSRVKIELVSFDNNTDADKYMFAAEKDENAMVGRIDTKMVAIFSTRGEDRDGVGNVLTALMPRNLPPVVDNTVPPTDDTVDKDNLPEDSETPTEGPADPTKDDPLPLGDDTQEEPPSPDNLPENTDDA